MFEVKHRKSVLFFLLHVFARADPLVEDLRGGVEEFFLGLGFRV